MAWHVPNAFDFETIKKMHLVDGDDGIISKKCSHMTPLTKYFCLTISMKENLISICYLFSNGSKQNNAVFYEIIKWFSVLISMSWIELCICRRSTMHFTDRLQDLFVMCGFARCICHSLWIMCCCSHNIVARHMWPAVDHWKQCTRTLALAHSQTCIDPCLCLSIIITAVIII